MMFKLLDGKVVRDEIKGNLRTVILPMKEKPVLAIVQVGDNAESNTYIEQKKKFAEQIGAEVRHVRLPDAVVEDAVIAQINELNADRAVKGILLQLPIPAGLNKEAVIETIDPNKDVDGLTSTSVKKLWSNTKDGFVPATAKAVISLLDYYGIILEGKHVVIIGRSELVGKPLFLSFINRNATVTLCHSKTNNLKETSQKADILVVAVGDPEFVTKDFVSQGQVVVDVGINSVPANGNKLQEEVADRRLVGDVKFDEVKTVVGALSPVPGGVGPLTVASLFENLVQAVNSRV